MANRFLIGILVLLGSIGFASSELFAAEREKLPMAELNDEGVYTQPWFYESFLDLREDIVDSKSEGKQLVIIWEQRGCPYCKETHAVNLRIPEVVNYIKSNFNVIQLNLWGDREVTDVDGEVTTEKKLARKYRIQFTPTMQFFPMDTEKTGKNAGQYKEIWRLLGYWKPFHFLNSFVYVREKGYQTEPNFQRWLQIRAEKLRAEGKDVTLW